MNKNILNYYLSPLDAYLNDERVCEITATKQGEVAIEIIGEGYKKIIREDLDKVYWVNLCYVLANSQGLLFDIDDNPILSTELPGGHRFEALMGSNVYSDLSVSIRVKHDKRWSLSEFGLSNEQIHSIVSGLMVGSNILIAGGTNTGKTSLLNSLLEITPKYGRIVSLEDTHEIQLDEFPYATQLLLDRQGNDLHLTSNKLIDHIMRVRPDRVIAGEVSIQNAYPILRLLNSGHKGFLCTIHANSAEDALLTTFTQNVVLSGIADRGVTSLLAHCFDLVIYLERTEDYKRKVRELYCPQNKKKKQKELKEVDKAT